MTQLTKNTFSLILGLIASLSIGQMLHAQEAAVAEEPAEETAKLLDKMIMNGKVKWNLRLRYEYKDNNGANDPGHAPTARLRIGYETPELPVFEEGIGGAIKSYVELEATLSVGNEYSGGPTQTVAGRETILDPENGEVNQLYAQYENEQVLVRGGRQRIILDDARFVGNVGWRQNEQTYDAILVQAKPWNGLSGSYSYVWRVNRIFGRTGPNFDSQTHLLNGSYVLPKDLPVAGKFTVFTYLMEFPGSNRQDNNTYGFRFAGNVPVAITEKGVKVNYAVSYAFQEAGDDNPVQYEANYFNADLSISAFGVTVGGGYELLGSDNGTGAFITPLATVHKFNGFADRFITPGDGIGSPASGIHDIYGYIKGKIPDTGVNTAFIYHYFTADESVGGTDEYGHELNIVVSRKLHEISDHATALIKFAQYFASDNAIAGFTNDTTVVTFQIDIAS